mmetsp:Transcript_14615/g.21298  ORF Transcript_14615/g.21298 Transcript_14615/m.21298 type:complete len:83 (-) Transcript_14615:245-493(-)
MRTYRLREASFIYLFLSASRTYWSFIHCTIVFLICLRKSHRLRQTKTGINLPLNQNRTYIKNFLPRVAISFDQSNSWTLWKF